MLSKKEIQGPVLSIVSTKPEMKVKVVKMENPVVLPANVEKRKGHLLPPPDKFNTAYFKGRDKDIL